MQPNLTDFQTRVLAAINGGKQDYWAILHEVYPKDSERNRRARPGRITQIGYACVVLMQRGLVNQPFYRNDCACFTPVTK